METCRERILLLKVMVDPIAPQEPCEILVLHSLRKASTEENLR